MKPCFTWLAIAAFVAVPAAAFAGDAGEPAGDVCARCPPAYMAPTGGDYLRGAALETNVLWPFFPGGISEFRFLIPIVRSDRRDFRGELVLGTYADFASRVVRDESDGKVRNLSGKFGFRQFFWSGTHLEVSANVGWRNETERPDGESYDALHARLWVLAGYQHDFSRKFYANARAALGVHLYRSDRFASEERQLVPGADLNLGFRFH